MTWMDIPIGSWMEGRLQYRGLNISDTEPRCGWDVNLGTWLEARHDVDGVVMQILGHG